MVTKGLVVELHAKPGKEEELAEFLAGAERLVADEPGTPVWLALRTDETTFWIVDAFPGDEERQAHLTGRVAAGLMAGAPEMLARDPEIRHADVLGSKGAA